MIDTLVEDEVRNELIYKSLPIEGTYVETGVFLGGNIIRVANKTAEHFLHLNIIGIDNFKFENISEQCFSYYKVPIGLKSYYDYVSNNIKEHAKYPVKLIDSDSISALHTFDDKSIDVLFVDDSHEYEHVKKLLNVALPKMKVDGIIVGHDWPDTNVNRAVIEFFGRHPDKVSSSNGGYLYYI